MSNDEKPKPPAEVEARAKVSELLKENIGQNGTLNLKNLHAALRKASYSDDNWERLAKEKLYYTAADEVLGHIPREQWSGVPLTRKITNEMKKLLEPIDLFNWLDESLPMDKPSNYGLQCKMLPNDKRPKTITTVISCEIAAPDTPVVEKGDRPRGGR